jgi:hypothetical protein
VRSQEDDVLGFQQEVELGQVEDELLAERALEAEVEVVQGLDRRQPGGLDAQLPAGGLPGQDLFLQHRGQVALVRPAFDAGPLGQRGGRSPDARCLQRPGQVG